MANIHDHHIGRQRVRHDHPADGWHLHDEAHRRIPDAPCGDRAEDCVCGLPRRDGHAIHSCPCGGQWTRTNDVFHVVSWPGSNPDWDGRHPDLALDVAGRGRP